MRHHLPSLAVLFTALMFAACDATEPLDTPDPVLSSYPRKHLIEEFTAQSCGYCPYGMDCVHDFVKDDDSWIVVLHHAGYQNDNFTVAGSTMIANDLRVDGAPSITIDRKKTTFKDDEGNTASQIVFHPGYLELTPKDQFEETSDISVNIHRSYNAKKRELTVRVSGVCVGDEIPDEVTVTVLIKESGMVAPQYDYYTEGLKNHRWRQFTHANAVRAFLSDPEGDFALINNENRYARQYTLTLKDEWVAENCMIVAFISTDFKPVLQAEQCPVVKGTQGGADILHGGIE